MGFVKGLQSIFTVKINVVLHFLTIHSRFNLQRIAFLTNKVDSDLNIFSDWVVISKILHNTNLNTLSSVGYRIFHKILFICNATHYRCHYFYWIDQVLWCPVVLIRTTRVRWSLLPVDTRLLPHFVPYVTTLLGGLFIKLFRFLYVKTRLVFYIFLTRFESERGQQFVLICSLLFYTSQSSLEGGCRPSGLV